MVDILVVSSPVKLQIQIGLEDESQLTTSLVHLVVLIREVLIVEEALLSAIEACHRKGQLLRRAVIMGNLNVTPQTRTDAKLNIRTLIVHRILRIDAHQSTFRILTVQRTLRTTQHVNSVQHIEVVVESRLRHQGNIVVVNTNSGVVDARANTSDIH